MIGDEKYAAHGNDLSIYIFTYIKLEYARPKFAKCIHEAASFVFDDIEIT